MQRPTSVTVFGVLNIVFAAFGCFGTLGSLALFRLPADSGNPVIEIMRDNPMLMLWMKICIPIGVVMCGVLLAAGIGLLLLKAWARLLSMGYAIFALGWGFLGLLINFLFLVRPLLAQAQTQRGAEAAGAAGGAIGSVLGGCFGMVYPILLIIFMLRPNVVAAFRKSPPDFRPDGV